MTAPEKLPGEVWRGTVPLNHGEMLCAMTSAGPVWYTPNGWRTPDYSNERERITRAWGLAMMAERDAAYAWRYDAEYREAEMAASLRDALAEVTRLRGLPPSLPGYGHDEELVADEAARLQDWYERTGKTIIAKPREP